MSLFQKYRRLCPSNPLSNVFYLQPSRCPTDTCWYSQQPLGHTTLSSTVSRLCKQAGIEGYKTNHSLRTTATTRLYHSSVDEQQIMERTGASTLGGRSLFKKTSEKQKQALSDVLNRSTNDPLATSSTNITHPPPAVVDSGSKTTSCAFTSQQQLHSLSLTGATFQDCTVNFYVGSTSRELSSRSKRRRSLIIDQTASSNLCCKSLIPPHSHDISNCVTATIHLP